MPINLQESSVKLMCGDHAIAKMYCQGHAIYSSGNTVTYHVDVGVSYQEEVDEGASCLSPASFTPSRDGWEFTGWRQDTDADGEVMSELLMGDAPITLYAVFTQTVTLSYNGNSATSGNMAAQNGTRYYNNGSVENPSFVLSANGFSRTSYTFSKWALDSAGGTQYAVGASITLAANATMYAIWKAASFSPILNGVLQPGTYIRAWPLVYNVISGDAGGYNLPAPSGDDGLSNVYGHYSHTSGNGNSFVGAEIYFYSNGLKTLEVTPRKYGNRGTIALLVYGDNEKNIYDNEIANHGTQYTINISNHSVIHIIVRIYDTGYYWLGGGIQTITCR